MRKPNKIRFFAKVSFIRNEDYEIRNFIRELHYNRLVHSANEVHEEVF